MKYNNLNNKKNYITRNVVSKNNKNNKNKKNKNSKKITKKIEYIYYKNGVKITDKTILNKISHIYIAPAYKNVRIFLNSDLLATGIDEAGRKQYVYSEEFKKKREIKKFDKMIKLSKSIDALQKKIDKDLNEKYMTKDKLIATELKIMQLCNFRGGTKKNEKLYKSHGITTIHKKHVSIKNNGSVEFKFIGKKGVLNEAILTDKKVCEIIKKICKMSISKSPYLFHIKNEKGEIIEVSNTDLNNYLKNLVVKL